MMTFSLIISLIILGHISNTVSAKEVGKRKQIILKLLQHNETYVFSLPSAYARSILTVPWMELGDRVTIQCNETGYSSKVVFETKPFYGGKLHKVVAEAKSPDEKVICKVNGEWNDVLEFSYANGTSKRIDTKKLNIMRKRVKPLRAQKEFESRQLWRYVTESLKTGDLDAATEFKRQLEQRQRAEEQVRRNTQASFPTKYFHLEGDTWVFNDNMKYKGEAPI